MKSFLTRACILACTWIILGSATPTFKHNTPAAQPTFYYWYWQDGDSFLEWASVSTAINDLESITGKIVNSSPGGGTLIANGYTNNNQPHTMIPAIKLYTH